MEERDEHLWRMARKRANFQRSIAAYVIVNGFLWFIWWFTAGRHGYNNDMPWPVWPMIGWGIGLAFQYLDSYGGNKGDLVQKEYDRLKNKQKESQ